MKDAVTQLLAEAARAPSGDNLQPWRCSLDSHTLTISLIPGRDASLYNWKERGSLIALGAFLENIIVLAPEFGLGAAADVPATSALAEDVRITVDLTPAAEKRTTGLREAVALRATNRKPYAKQPLSDALRAALRGVEQDERFDEFGLRIVEDRRDMETLGRAVAQNEHILFGNRTLHDFFFSHIAWDSPGPLPDIGFPEQALEIPKEGRAIFRAMRSWAVTKFLRSIRLTSLIVRDNAKLYATGGAHLAILHRSAGEMRPGDYVRFGMFLERLWLVATKEGYWIQPLMGIIFLFRRIREQKDGFSARECDIIHTAAKTIQSVVGEGSGEIIGLLRIGTAPLPSVRTPRAAINIENAT